MLGTVALPPQPCFALQPRLRFVSAAVAEVAPDAAAAVDKRSLYEVLQVKRGASQVEIKTAYRTLAKLHHPDAKSRFLESSIASSADGRDFMEIRDAYDTLSDPDARAVYDFHLNANSKRRWNTSGGLSGSQIPVRRRFYPIRRWETDQCW